MTAGIYHTEIFFFVLTLLRPILHPVHYLIKNVSVANGEELRPTGVAANSRNERETTGLLLQSLTYTFCHLQSTTQLRAVRNDACAFPARAVCASCDSQNE
jgi:hypothetical protein